MKIVFITCTLFFLLNCSTQTDRTTDFDIEDQSAVSESSSMNKEDIQSSKRKDSVSTPVTNETEKTQDICASRKDTIISYEIDSLVKSEFPDYRIARNSDFPEGYWCHFYSEHQSPYYVTGDFDGDDEIETVLMINKDERYSTLIILIDKKDGRLQALTIEEYKIRTDIDIELRFTKYGYGLKTKAPFKFKTIASDTTYDIRTEIIVIEGFEEKADYYYYYENGEYKELMIGC
jgi:hypothetical protein